MYSLPSCNEQRIKFPSKKDIEEYTPIDIQWYRDAWLKHFFRPASVQDYEEWLWAFMRNRGQPTHYYDYDMPNAFFVALRDFKTNPLFGSLAVEIIVPKEVSHMGGDLGHCNIYFMNSLVNRGGWVPIYGNMKVPNDLQTRVTAFKNQQEAQARDFTNRQLGRDKSLIQSWKTFAEKEGVYVPRHLNGWRGP